MCVKKLYKCVSKAATKRKHRKYVETMYGKGFSFYLQHKNVMRETTSKKIIIMGMENHLKLYKGIMVDC